MRYLLRVFAWRHARRHPARAALGAASIALGVALFVSAEIANSTVEQAFEQTIEKLAGKAKLRATFSSGAGIDTEALARIESIPGMIAAPVLQRSTSLSELQDGPVLVFGVDFMKDRLLRLYDFKANKEDLKGFIATAFVPDGIVVTRRFAQRHGLDVKSPLVLDTPKGKTRLTVTGVMENEGPASVFGGNFMVMHLATAQRLFTKKGLIDRIEIAPPDGMSVPEARERIQSLLGGDYAVEPLQRRSAVLEDAMSRVRALVIVSVVALIVGVFIIYNSVSISVVERVRDMAILRSIGTLRRQILSLVLVEWSIIGFLGSVLGVALGYTLARFLVQVSAKAANTLTLSIDVREMAFRWSTAGAAVAVGTFVSLLAALFPAREAMRVPPMGLMGQALYSYRLTPKYFRSFIAGSVMIFGGAVMVVGFFLKLPAGGGLVATVLVFVGVGLATPQVTIWIARLTRPVLRRHFHIEGYLAADNVSKFPQRTALTTIALGGALSMMVASATFLLSLKTSADKWMQEAFPFDLSINGTDLSKQLYSPARFPDSLATDVATVPGIESLYTVSVHYQPYHDSEVMLLGIDMEAAYAMHQKRGFFERMELLFDPVRRGRLVRGEGIIVSQNFSHRYGAPEGAKVVLQTAEGPHTFEVLKSVEEYSWPSGTVIMDRGIYSRLWKDDHLAYIDIRVAPGTPINDVKARLGEKLKGSYTMFLYTPDDIRGIASDALEQAFALSNVQVLIAIIIGFLGILNTLLISVLRRTREIGLLRAVGATRGQIRRTVVIESIFIAAVGGAIGVVAGIAGAALPLRLHTLQVTGYWIPLTIPWATLGLALIAALGIGWVASWIPARRATNLNVLEAISYE